MMRPVSCLPCQELGEFGALVQHKALRCEYWWAMRGSAATAQELTRFVSSLEPVQVSRDLHAPSHPLMQLPVTPLPTCTS